LSNKTLGKEDGREDKVLEEDKYPRNNEERVGLFHTTPRNILMEINGNPMLRRSKPIEALTKFRYKN